MENGNNRSTGIGFTGLLQLAFIVLKLCGVINWRWVYVFMPTIVTIVIVLILLVVIVFLESRR